ncbi:MAG: segregation/condensation protein A [Thermomicrobiales bacterium]|nr:segregation/condensation protein A [Thermomicrobiales bacterium]
MATTSSAMPTLDGYQLRLSVFEGPLDVLLRLIERERLPISEVSLLAVLDQFIAYSRTLESPAPEVVAEFAAVAGRLSLLKSRSLLPRPVREPEESDEADLVRRLAEYRAVKAAAELLAARQRDGSGSFGRGEAIAGPEAAPPRLVPQPPTALTKAVRRWFARLPERPALVPGRRIVTLREMIARILGSLASHPTVSFESIRQSCQSRQEVAAGFLAMLTLLRRHAIVARQESLFGEIVMAKAEPPEDDASASRTG